MKKTNIDDEKRKLENLANAERVESLTKVLLLNAEESVEIPGGHLGHITVMFVNSASQGFYFSFGPSGDVDKGELGKTIGCTGEVVFKTFGPTAFNEFLKRGIVKKALLKKTNGKIEEKDEETSKYTRYITIEGTNINLENMYLKSFSLYKYVPYYSGIGYNCSHFVSEVISQGGSDWEDICENIKVTSTIPNLFFKEMSFICQNTMMISNK